MLIFFKLLLFNHFLLSVFSMNTNKIQAKFNKFLEWGHENGLMINGMKFLQENESHRKVVASKDMKKNDLIIFVRFFYFLEPSHNCPKR
jgi:hypothetical protein